MGLRYLPGVPSQGSVDFDKEKILRLNLSTSQTFSPYSSAISQDANLIDLTASTTEFINFQMEYTPIIAYDPVKNPNYTKKSNKVNIPNSNILAENSNNISIKLSKLPFAVISGSTNSAKITGTIKGIVTRNYTSPNYARRGGLSVIAGQTLEYSVSSAAIYRPVYNIIAPERVYKNKQFPLLIKSSGFVGGNLSINYRSGIGYTNGFWLPNDSKDTVIMLPASFDQTRYTSLNIIVLYPNGYPINLQIPASK